MTAIEFENISKQYRLGLVSTRTLSHDLNRWWTVNVLRKEDPYLKIGETNDRATKGQSDYVWALKDINFKVEQGDVVGIIGKNGAGKSTLLKLLSKVTAPTTGHIRARGRIASLLEVGTGFHPEMTGRENIYMNGAILGMTKQEIRSKLDEIVDFSGCERYLDTPVKRYSSGMTVRLGFAIAAHLDPEILVVDEVLAVGDAEFQKKAIGKMKDVSQGEGRTVLFVSHNMASIKSLCKSGVLLENGIVKYQSDNISDVVAEYVKVNDIALYDYTEIVNTQHIGPILREIEYVSVKLLNDVNAVSTEEPLMFEMIIRRNNPTIKRCQFGIVIRNMEDTVIGANYSDMCELPDDANLMKVQLVFPNHYLAKGRYKVNLNLSVYDYTAVVRDYDVIGDVLRFEVTHLDAAHTHPFNIWPFGTGCAFRNSTISITKI